MWVWIVSLVLFGSTVNCNCIGGLFVFLCFGFWGLWCFDWQGCCFVDCIAVLDLVLSGCLGYCFGGVSCLFGLCLLCLLLLACWL